MSDIFDPTNIPIIEREENHIQEIAESVEAIKSLMGQTSEGNTYSRRPSTEAREQKPSPSPSPIGDKEKQDNFFTKLGEKFGELTQTFKQASENLGKNVGQVAFSTLLGPLQLITKPFEEAAGISFFDLLGRLVPKPFKGRPTKAKVLPKDPGAVLIANTIKGVEEEKDGGFLKGLLKGDWLAKIGKFLPILGAIAAPLIFVGTMLTDLLGKGGAIELWKKGEFGKAIFTGLFGKDLSQKGTVGKLLGIGKQALKWGALGFMIGGPIGGLIGLAVGAAGAAIKLGVDTGWFEKMFKKAKDVFEPLIEWVRNLLQPIVDWLKKAWGVGRNIPVVGLIFRYAEMVFNFWRNWFGSFIRFFRDVFKDPIQAFKNLGNDLLNAILGRIEDMLALVGVNVDLREIGGVVFDAVKRVFNKVVEAWQNFREDPMGFMQGLFDEIKMFVSDVVNKIKQTFQDIRDRITGFFQSIGDFFGFLGTLRPTDLLNIGDLISGERFQTFKAERIVARDPEMEQFVRQTREFREAAANRRTTDAEALQQAVQQLASEILTKAKPTTVIQQNTNDPLSVGNVDRDIMGGR